MQLNHRRIILISVIILASSVFFKLISRVQLLSKHLPTSITPFLVPTSRLSSTMSTSPTYVHELRIASLAVQRATLLTQRVFHEKTKGTVSKDDASPVTIGDFGAQALIISAIKHNFPSDEVVGEEEASTLRENPKLSDQIWSLVKDAKLSDSASESELGKIKDQEAMLAAIDAGNSSGGKKGRFWALDPIDGTKGFLRQGQYAVCLALVEDGQVKVGVLGCPNLPVDDKAPLSADVEGGRRGVLFGSVEGYGASSQPLGTGALEHNTPISMRSIADLKEATFCESVEAGHSSHGDQAEIAKKLGITRESVRMDSQAKYASLARGAGDIYLRLPVKKDYQEKIWDHAAGDLIVREAGGAVTDITGKRLDFSQGRTLKENKGVVAAPKQVHGEVLEVVKSVLAGKQ